MHRTLGTLFLLVALAATGGCGSSTSSTATGPDSPTPGPVPGTHVLPLISMTGVGGRVSTTGSSLETPAQVHGFIRQFRVPAMAHQVAHAAARAEQDGQLTFGAVVAIGCDRPPGVDVVLDASGNVQILPREVASPLPECLAAVTTVAVVSVPGAD